MIVLCALLASCSKTPDTYFIEAENFDDRGGWVHDHQAFPKIGSAYLMAHGMGVPVEDAVTEINIKRPGEYYIYVSTYNWTSPWYTGAGPGAYTLLVNGKPVQEVLGTTGTEWEWQCIGKIRLEGRTELCLHDLTGFNGRIDAIYITPEQEKMPQSYEEMLAFRNRKSSNYQIHREKKADLVVVGAGVAGCTTALAAARSGLDIILIDNHSKLGGNNYLGVKMSGLMSKNKYPQLGNLVRELSGISTEEYWKNPNREDIRPNGNGHPIMSDDREAIAALREQILKEAKVRVYHDIHIYEAEKDGRTVTSVLGKHLFNNEDYLFTGKLFADCTGDGDVGYLLGAEYMIGREPKSFADEQSAPETPDNKMMGGTLNWNAVEEAEASAFPDVKDLPWAMQCSDDYFVKGTKHGWTWETGFEIDNAKEAELVRDNMFRAIYGNWAYLKNHQEGYSNWRLEKVGQFIQKRESRRLYGDLVLNENDVRNAVEYPDASFTTTWTLDLHFPQKTNTAHFPGWEWRSGCPNKDKSSWIEPYHVPYRVLYSRDFDNLFIGGRCMSVTHVALGTVRVQTTLGMAGEVTGMAAGICKKYDVTPRQVYTDHLDELIALMEKGL